MVTHEDPELTSSPPTPTPQRQRNSLTKTPTQQGGISGTEPLPEDEESVCAPHPAPRPWDLHQSDEVPKHQTLEQWDPGCLWGSEIPLLRSLNTETHPGNQEPKAAVWEVARLYMKEIQLLVLKLQPEARGISQGYPGAGEVLENAILHSPLPRGTEGQRDTASWKLRGVGPLALLLHHYRQVCPTLPLSQPWFPTGNAWPDWWPEGLMLLGPAGPWQSESHFNILTFFTVSV